MNSKVLSFASLSLSFDVAASDSRVALPGSGVGGRVPVTIEITPRGESDMEWLDRPGIDVTASLSLRHELQGGADHLALERAVPATARGRPRILVCSTAKLRGRSAQWVEDYCAAHRYESDNRRILASHSVRSYCSNLQEEDACLASEGW
jgi:hypothetical protein